MASDGTLPRTHPKPTLILAILGACSFSQHLPLMFLSVAVPAMLRQSGLPLEQVSLVGLAFLPFAFQVLWAPLLDRYDLSALGRWRGWIIVTQVCGGVALGAAAAFAPTEAFGTFMAIAVTLSLIAGTQKIAQAAYGVEAVDSGWRPWVNVAQGFGAALGTAAGTLGLLALYDRAGWPTTMLICGAILLAIAVVLPLLPPAPVPDSKAKRTDVSLKVMFANPHFFPAARYALWLGFPLGTLFGLMQPRLIDAGYSLEDVGLINGLGYLTAWVIAGPAAGAIASRLPTRSSYAATGLVIFCLCVFSAAAAYWLPADRYLAAATAIAGYATICFGAVRLYTSFMGATRPDYAATDINALICFFSLTTIVAAGVSGSVAAQAGYAGAYMFASLWLLCGLVPKLTSQQAGQN